MAFDPVSGQVYGTPYQTGVFIFSVSASSSNNPVITKMYPFMVSAAGAVVLPHSAVDLTVALAGAGSATGAGVYTNGTTATVTAVPNAGYAFVNWAENGNVVSTSAAYTFTNVVNQSLVANFVAAPTLSLVFQPNALVVTWSTKFSGFTLQQNSDLGTTNWVVATEPVVTVATNYQATILATNGSWFFRLLHQ
jgi:hypothetical protein